MAANKRAGGSPENLIPALRDLVPQLFQPENTPPNFLVVTDEVDGRPAYAVMLCPNGAGFDHAARAVDAHLGFVGGVSSTYMLWLDGHTHREIAELRGVDLAVVKSDLKLIRAALGVSSRAQALAYVRRWEWTVH